jgi:hypothetical protein
MPPLALHDVVACDAIVPQFVRACMFVHARHGALHTHVQPSVVAVFPAVSGCGPSVLAAFALCFGRSSFPPLFAAAMTELEDNAVNMVKLLIKHGADVRATAVIGGETSMCSPQQRG